MEQNSDTLILNIPPSLKARLREAANREMLPMASYVRRIIDAAIKEEANANDR